MPLVLHVGILSGLIGLIVGSFVNVLIYRLPREISILKPPSQCPHCKTRVRWRDNVPIVGFLLLRGRCRHCQARISFRYPLVESLVSLLFVMTSYFFPWDWILWVHHWPFVAIMAAVIFIDLDFRIIPDSLSLGGTVLGLITSPWVPGLGLTNSLLGAGVGFGSFLFFAWTYHKLTGRMGLGGGDIKLLAAIGAFLGLQGVFFTVLSSSILGSVIGITWALFNKSGSEGVMKVAIPYGPFLVIGAFSYYFFGDLWLQFMTPM